MRNTIRLPVQRHPRRHLNVLRAAFLAAACVGSGTVQAQAEGIDFGPFNLTGFAKVEAVRRSAMCPDNRCQRDPLASKEFVWADELVQGSTYSPGNTHVTLFQPFLSGKFDLVGGVKLKGLLSQRWRDGKEDFKGYLYDRSIGLEHEDWGSVTVGAMTTRAWHLSDYPFGTDVGLADAWASSGSGYGLLTRAVRLTSRTLDVLGGDVVVEGTYDLGERGWQRNKPRFFELWAHYGSRDLTVDMMLQNTLNGTPSAFTHGPFTAPFYDNRYDQLLGSSSQGLAMVIARWRYTTKIEFMGGVRANRWSGAYARLLLPASRNPEGYDIWNSPFNVDWKTDLGGGLYKGYGARSTDFLMGGRYKVGLWTASAAVMRLGAASTANPSERGQSNAATIGALSLGYQVSKGLQIYGLAGAVSYARLGLAPTSMPSNAAFTGIDSRLTRRGNWVGSGITYTF